MHELELAGGELSALHNTMCALETRWIPAVSGEGRGGSHPAVSYPIGLFMRGMQLARDHFSEAEHQPRFLDAGCGIGTKVALASQLNWQADGLDFVPEYCSAARELCGPASVIYETDARDFDQYGDYDLVYCYRCLVDEQACAQLAEQVAEQLKPGAMMFLAWWPYLETPLLKCYEEALWVRT
jgi:SAM-dependent methyltransferase